MIVPIINPDGFFASRMASEDGMFPDPADSTGAPEADTVEGVVLPFGGNLAYRRKNCNGPVPSFEGEQDMPCYYQWGVDPNRNYGHGWGGKGAGSDPNTQSYRGDDQWSEPETQAVHAYSQKNPISTFVSIHNVAALVLRPPGKGDEGKAPDELEMKAIGDAMADATGYKSQYSFQLYDTSGTTEDWNYNKAGTYGYTIEVGPANGQFHMPYETGVVNEWVGPEGKGGMREALMIGARTAADPTSHSVLEGKAPAGTVLKVRKDFETNSSPVCTYSQGVIASSPPPTDCLAPGPVRSQKDHLEYTTVVPESGAFSWHVTQSTPPFVGAKFAEGERTDSTETVEGPGPEATEEQQTVTHEFDVAPDAGTSELDLRLSFLAKAEDYDLTLEYVEADGSRTGVGTAYIVDGALLWTTPGSGGNPNGLDEHIVVAQPKPGRYVATVTNATGVTNDWTLTVASKGQKQGARQSTGEKESWTFTCERDGQVLESRQVVVDRGQRLDLGRVCGKKPKDEDKGAPGKGASGADTTAPRLTGLSLAPRAFSRKRGTRIRYTVSEPATVAFAVQRKAKGRRAGRRCAAPSRRNRGARRCTRYVTKGVALTRRSAAGRSAVRWTGRVQGARLARGRYRLVAVAADAAGNRSTAARKTFRVKRR